MSQQHLKEEKKFKLSCSMLSSMSSQFAPLARTHFVRTSCLLLLLCGNSHDVIFPSYVDCASLRSYSVRYILLFCVAVERDVSKHIKHSRAAETKNFFLTSASCARGNTSANPFTFINTRAKVVCSICDARWPCNNKRDGFGSGRRREDKCGSILSRKFATLARRRKSFEEEEKWNLPLKAFFFRIWIFIAFWTPSYFPPNSRYGGKINDGNSRIRRGKITCSGEVRRNVFHSLISHPPAGFPGNAAHLLTNEMSDASLRALPTAVPR